MGFRGLQLWLDAQDSSTFTFSSAPIISRWADKSGNSYHATLAAGSPKLTNGKVAFDGSSYFTLPTNAIPYGDSSYSMYTVVNFADTSGNYVILSGGPAGCGTSMGMRAIGSSTQNWWYCNDLTSSGTSGTFTAGTTLLYTAQYQSGGQRSVYMYGALVGSDTPGKRSQVNSPNYVGYLPGNSVNFNMKGMHV